MEIIDEPLLDIKEMSKLLSVSEESLRQKMYKDEKIPFYKVGGELRFSKKEILEYFRRPKTDKAVANDKT